MQNYFTWSSKTLNRFWTYWHVCWNRCFLSNFPSIRHIRRLTYGTLRIRKTHHVHGDVYARNLEGYPTAIVFRMDNHKLKYQLTCTRRWGITDKSVTCHVSGCLIWYPTFNMISSTGMWWNNLRGYLDYKVHNVWGS